MIQYMWRFPIVELAVFAMLTLSLVLSWRKVDQGLEESVSERTLGANVLLGQLSGTILAGSIILGLIGVFAAVLESLEAMVVVHIEWAVMWALLSLITAVYGLAMMPTVVWKRNPIRVRPLAFAAAWALFFFVAATVRFFFALKSLI